MSLEGTLETIALPDVLALLSVTAKTGELRIEAGGGMGSVWFDAGRVAGFDVGSHWTAVDALFALLRLREGSFKFYTGTSPVNVIAPEEVGPLLEEAESRLGQWPGIASAVPSIYCGLGLQESVDGTVMLRPDQWQLVATIGDGRTVAEVLDARRLAEFDGCKAIKELVDLRLVKVSTPETAPDVPELTPSTANTPDLSELAVAAAEVPEAPVVEEAEVPRFSDVTEAPDAPDVYDGYGLHDLHPTEYALDVEPGTQPEPVDAYDAGDVPQVSYHSAESPEPMDWRVPEYPDLPEVADLSEVWDDEAGEVRRVNMNDLTASAEPPAVEPEPEAPAPDPVNRGMLLRFLGSARN